MDNVCIRQTVSGDNKELYETLQMFQSAVHSKPDCDPLCEVMLETANHGMVAHYCYLTARKSLIQVSFEPGSLCAWSLHVLLTERCDSVGSTVYSQQGCLWFESQLACPPSLCVGLLWVIWFPPQFKDMEDMYI